MLDAPFRCALVFDPNGFEVDQVRPSSPPFGFSTLAMSAPIQASASVQAALAAGAAMLLADGGAVFAPVTGMVGGIAGVALANHERLKQRIEVLEKRLAQAEWRGQPRRLKFRFGEPPVSLSLPPCRVPRGPGNTMIIP
jgi:hypothetical protein